MKDNNAAMVAVKLPKGCLDFVSRNQKLAKGVGEVVMALTALKAVRDRSIKSFDKLMNDFNNNKLFSQLIEDGTEEELKEFLGAVSESLRTGGVETIENATEEKIQEFIDKAKGAGRRTEITDVTVSDDESKEVNPNLN